MLLCFHHKIGTVHQSPALRDLTWAVTQGRQGVAPRCYWLSSNWQWARLWGLHPERLFPQSAILEFTLPLGKWWLSP